MEEFKLGEIVYCPDAYDYWRIGHFAGMRDGQFLTALNYTTALEGVGSGSPKCLSIEDYQKMLNAPKDKDLAWCWDDDKRLGRAAVFYDEKNQRTFLTGSGHRKGMRFDNYEVIKDWRNKPEFAWAVEVFEQLKD